MIKTFLKAVTVCQATAVFGVSAALAQSGWFIQRELPARNTLQAIASLDEETAIAIGDGPIILRTIDAGLHWTLQYEDEQPFQRYLNGVSFFGAKIGMAVGLGRIMRSDDAGVTWKRVEPFTTDWFYDVSLLDASNAIVVGFRGLVVRSTDGGSTWTRQVSGTMDSLFGVSFVDANIGVAVGENGRIIRTTNGGRTWSGIFSPTGLSLWGVSLIDGSTGFASGNSGTILRTMDGGLSWTVLDSGSTAHFGRPSFVDAYTGWVPTAGGNLRTTDGGESWISQPVDRNCCAAASFVDAKTGTAAGGFGTIFRTVDGGDTWISQYGSEGPLEVLEAVSCPDAETGIAVGTGGLILRTTDMGATWTPQNSGTTADLNAVQFFDAATGTAVGKRGTILRTIDGGETWIPQSTGSIGDVRDVSFIDADRGWVADGRLLHTIDGGATWSEQSIEHFLVWSVSFADERNGLVGGRVEYPSESARILRTTDGGASWTSLYEDYSGLSLRVAWIGKLIFAVAPRLRVVFSRDGGLTWALVPVGIEVWRFSILDSDTVFAIGTRGINSAGIAKTTDGGATWMDQSAPLGRGGLRGACFVNANIGSAVGQNGLILRTETGGD